LSSLIASPEMLSEIHKKNTEYRDQEDAIKLYEETKDFGPTPEEAQSLVDEVEEGISFLDDLDAMDPMLNHILTPPEEMERSKEEFFKDNVRRVRIMED
jgi:hypothetical protein